MSERYYEITRTDVRKPHVSCFGRVWPVSSFIGCILEMDIGKRVYLRSGILQVENNEQRAARLIRQGG